MTTAIAQHLTDAQEQYGVAIADYALNPCQETKRKMLAKMRALSKLAKTKTPQKQSHVTLH
jgi:hypothetical protein